MAEPVQLPFALKPDIDKFIDDMMAHAQELHAILRRNEDDDKIKDRITCLKYLEEVTKTYFILKKASTHDPDAAGSTVRKYATAFAKSATDIGAKRKRRSIKPATANESVDLDADGDDDGLPDTAA